VVVIFLIVDDVLSIMGNGGVIGDDLVDKNSVLLGVEVE